MKGKWSFLEAYKSFESLNDRGKYIFDILQKKGPITKNELIDKTKIKLTTLNRDLQILIDKKISKRIRNGTNRNINNFNFAELYRSIWIH